MMFFRNPNSVAEFKKKTSFVANCLMLLPIAGATFWLLGWFAPGFPENVLILFVLFVYGALIGFGVALKYYLVIFDRNPVNALTSIKKLSYTFFYFFILWVSTLLAAIYWSAGLPLVGFFFLLAFNLLGLFILFSVANKMIVRAGQLVAVGELSACSKRSSDEA